MRGELSWGKKEKGKGGSEWRKEERKKGRGEDSAEEMTATAENR